MSTQALITTHFATHLPFLEEQTLSQATQNALETVEHTYRECCWTPMTTQQFSF